MNPYLFILLGLLLAVIYVFQKRLLDPRRLLPLTAEIDRIRLGYMSSAQPEALKHLQGRLAARDEAGEGGRAPGSEAIAIPEVHVAYSYRFRGREYRGEGYVLLSEFLGATPYQLDFQKLGPDFPILRLPGEELTGEENIEDYLLRKMPHLGIEIDGSNPYLSTPAKSQTKEA